MVEHFAGLYQTSSYRVATRLILALGVYIFALRKMLYVLENLRGEYLGKTVQG